MSASEWWAAMVAMTLTALAVHLVPYSAIPFAVTGGLVATLLYARALWSRRS